MCHTGTCPYEVTHGDYVGECTLTSGTIPADAPCVLEIEIPEGMVLDTSAFDRAIERANDLACKKGRFRILALSE